MITAIYVGSFDPITKGHEDIILRSAKLVDKLYVASLLNVNKKSLFTISERINLLKKVVENIPNIEILTFNGLVVDFVEANNITFIIKGCRNFSDFESEFQMAGVNRLISNNVETLFIPTSPEVSSISSTLVKEVGKNKGNIDKLVPHCIKEEICSKFN